MIITNYKEDKPDIHWSELVRPLDLYIYSNVYEMSLYNQLKNTIVSHLDKYNKITFKTHRTTFTHNDRKIKVVSHQQNDRLQQIMYDLTFELDWWYQTKDTVYDWSWDYLQKNIHPLFFHHLQTFRNVEPQDDNWIPFRWHINYLPNTKFLFMHKDMDFQYFNEYCPRARTLTFYLHDHNPISGGELHTMSGYVYKPKQNEAISINGNEVFHGVNSNMSPDKNPRLAFSIRWAHKDDFYLPGSPEKSYYKLEY